MKLDKEQERVIYTNKRKVLVASNAGSGKTTCLVERLKFLLNKGIDSSKIFVLTYTNSAAQEIRERVNNSEVFIGTIHSLANRILLFNGIDTSNFLEEENFDILFEEVQKREIKIPKIEHILIDEFQDICENEYEFIMNRLEWENFFAVGDSCQSIFSFKGSNYKFFMELLNDSNTTVYELNNNYRCGEEIISFAETFLYGMEDVYQIPCNWKSGILGEVEVIPYERNSLLDYLKEADKYKDWFILCRRNSEIEDICNLLDKNKIPYTSFKKADLSLEKLREEMDSNKVKVLTVHSAKGLENKNVIVVGVKGWNAEEKRVCYVAATRAKEKLIWMKAAKKRKTPSANMVQW